MRTSMLTSFKKMFCILVQQIPMEIPSKQSALDLRPIDISWYPLSPFWLMKIFQTNLRLSVSYNSCQCINTEILVYLSSGTETMKDNRTSFMLHTIQEYPSHYLQPYYSFWVLFLQAYTKKNCQTLCICQKFWYTVTERCMKGNF